MKETSEEEKKKRISVDFCGPLDVLMINGNCRHFSSDRSACAS